MKSYGQEKGPFKETYPGPEMKSKGNTSALNLELVKETRSPPKQSQMLKSASVGKTL